MNEYKEMKGLAAWARCYADAEAEYEAAQEESRAKTQRKPFFHWVMALIFLLSYLVFPGYFYCSLREYWTPGDWVFYALLWAMGLLNTALSIYLALRDSGVSQALKPMHAFCDRLEMLRRETDDEEESAGPELRRFFDDCEEARWSRMKGLLLFRDEYRSFAEMLPLFALLLTAGLVPLVLAGLPGTWDLIDWVQNLLIMATACILTGLNLWMELAQRRDVKDYRVTETYLAALKRAHELYLRRAEHSAPRQG